MIPKQLSFMRFNRVRFKDKRAFESGWQNKPYSYEEIQKYFPKENYGVLCGKELRVLDDDTPHKGLIKIFIENFGETFRVRDHLYFKFDNGHDKKIIFNHKELKFKTSDGKETNHMGEIQGEGTYVVGAGSTHPSGEIYEQKNDLDIITISYDKFMKIFGDYIGSFDVKPSIKTTYNSEDDDFINSIKEKWVEGNRQELTMSLAGYLRKEKRLGLNNSLEIIRRICMDCGDVDFKERMAAVRATYDKDEKDVKGYSGLKEQCVEIEQKYNFMAFGKESNFIEIVSRFHRIQPFHYDKSKIWWLWNFRNSRWDMVDEVDLMNAIDENTRYPTSSPTIKANLLEAFKRVGRKNKPKQPMKTWIQFDNMVVDIETNEKFKATPEYFITNPIPHKLGENKETPAMDNLLEQWVGKKYVKTMKEIIAYVFLADMPIHRIFCLIGEGLNGKGTFLRLIENFVGDENKCATEIEILISNRFESSKLYKKLVCITGEIDKGIFTKTKTLKSLSGDDLIRFEFKGKNGFDAHNYAKPIIATNHLPETTDKSGGFYRRWCIVDFPNTFSEKKNVLNDISQEEYSNFCLASIDILKELLDKGTFENEGSILDRQGNYEKHAGFIKTFIKDYCELGGKLEHSFDDFCWKFNDFIVSEGGKKKSKVEIGRIIRSCGFEMKLKKVSGEFNTTTTKTFIFGIKINIGEILV